jgi:hypothetical protein
MHVSLTLFRLSDISMKKTPQNGVWEVLSGVMSEYRF